jgi:hypothetical protein
VLLNRKSGEDDGMICWKGWRKKSSSGLVGGFAFSDPLMPVRKAPFADLFFRFWSFYNSYSTIASAKFLFPILALLTTPIALPGI